MHTLSADDLTRDPQRLLDEANAGRLTLVTDGGKPLMLAVPLAMSSPIGEVLVELAAELYALELVGLERAARIASLSDSETIDELGRRGIAATRVATREP